MSRTEWPVAKVRETFVEFFKQKYAHAFIPTSPVVPRKDPTILFANAGMNQFKELFLGTADPNSDFGKLKRAVNSQICIRAGGKHNDLDDVGRDTYHHTFFEMLGSWSFGDYFKKEAIAWAWELLTEVYKLDKDRLYVTYFEGCEAQGVAADEETKGIWKQYVSEDRILPGNMKDNFWEMGDTGPCGPCTEIHYDRLGGRNAAHLVNKDDPMVIEVWNLVFMQFDRTSKGLKKLPSPHVDTGMGLERITSILQNVLSNYDTDAWTPLFDEIQKITGFRHGHGYEGADASQDAIVAYRVIADHIRCLVVALADGAMPDNVGRGFVLRRIIRRAVRFGVQFLGAQTGFFSQLVDAVVASLGPFFPHLADPRSVARTKAILLDEEKSFARTWQIGLKHFETAKATAVSAKSTEINSKDAFILHDRYGFPVDLTKLLAEKENMTVDVEGFKKEMKANQTSGGRVAAVKTFLENFQVDELQKKGVPTTADNAKYQWENAQGKVLAIFDKKAGVFVDSVTGTEEEEELNVGVILDCTNFYAEGGGQIYDTGSLGAKNGTFTVLRVYGYGGYICHIGRVAEGTLSVGETVDLDVNYERRLPIAVNHTCTHQLNHTLREVLQFGNPDAFTEVNQRGSIVTDDYLRFDFSWNAKLTAKEIADTEKLLNDVIAQDLPVFSKLVPLQDAMAIKSLRCMFDEKYPDPVTVVSIGKSMDEVLANPQDEELKKFSLELCGGTHIKSMGEAQDAVIVSEESSMKGVRRIIIYTRQAAAEARAEGVLYAKDFERIRTGYAPSELDDKLKALSVLQKKINDSMIPLTLKMQLRDDIEGEVKLTNTQKKEVAAANKQRAQDFGATLSKDAKGSLFVFQMTDFGADRECLQAIADAFQAALPDSGLCLIGVDAPKDKVLVMTFLSKSLVDKGLSAVTWAQKICGKAGGKPNAAQGGLTADKVDEAVKVAGAEVAAMASTAQL